jgi:hypothetical protein
MYMADKTAGAADSAGARSMPGKPHGRQSSPALDEAWR